MALLGQCSTPSLRPQRSLGSAHTLPSLTPDQGPDPHLTDGLAIWGLGRAEQAQHVLGALCHRVFNSEVVPQLLNAQLHCPQVRTPCGRRTQGSEASLRTRSNQTSPRHTAIHKNRHWPQTLSPPTCLKFLPRGSHSDTVTLSPAGRHTATVPPSVIYPNTTTHMDVPRDRGCHTETVIHTEAWYQHWLRDKHCQGSTSPLGNVTETPWTTRQPQEIVTQTWGHFLKK